MLSREKQFEEVYNAAKADAHWTNGNGNIDHVKRMGIKLDVSIDLLGILPGRLVHGSPILKLAFEGEDDSVNALLRQGASEAEAIYGYVLKGDKQWDRGSASHLITLGKFMATNSYFDYLLSKFNRGKCYDAAIKGYAARQDYEAVYHLQFQKQEYQRWFRTVFYIIAAVLFPPSMAVTVPLWFWQKNHEPIQKVTVLDKDYTDAKQVKKQVLSESAAIVKDAFKPKKIKFDRQKLPIPDQVVPNSTIYLMDRHQLGRFDLFSSTRNSKPLLKAHRPDIEMLLETSKEGSKRIIEEFETRHYSP